MSKEQNNEKVDQQTKSELEYNDQKRTRNVKTVSPEKNACITSISGLESVWESKSLDQCLELEKLDPNGTAVSYSITMVTFIPTGIVNKKMDNKMDKSLQLTTENESNVKDKGNKADQKIDKDSSYAIIGGSAGVLFAHDYFHDSDDLHRLNQKNIMKEEFNFDFDNTYTYRCNETKKEIFQEKIGSTIFSMALWNNMKSLSQHQKKAKAPDIFKFIWFPSEVQSMITQPEKNHKDDVAVDFWKYPCPYNGSIIGFSARTNEIFCGWLKSGDSNITTTTAPATNHSKQKMNHMMVVQLEHDTNNSKKWWLTSIRYFFTLNNNNNNNNNQT